MAPPRTASNNPRSRAKVTARTTSAVSTATNDQCRVLVNHPVQIRRAPSYPSSPRASSVPLRLARRSRTAATSMVVLGTGELYGAQICGGLGSRDKADSPALLRPRQ